MVDSDNTMRGFTCYYLAALFNFVYLLVPRIDPCFAKKCENDAKCKPSPNDETLCSEYNAIVKTIRNLKTSREKI